jgi:pimeloyl-CoA dehydrogenase small subunit
MDFTLSDEQRMLEETVSRLVRDEYDFESRRKLLDSPEGYSPQLWAAYAELGLLGVPFAEEYGGFGGGGVELLVLMQAFGRGLVLEPYLATVVLAGSLVERLGSDAQREALLGAVVGGELKLALAYAEPDGRYDHLHVNTRAERTNAGWRLSGAKAVVLHGDSADKLLVTARTADNTNDREGISVFVVDANAPGLSRRGYPTIDGLHAAELRLDGVEVDAEALLGEPGQAADALEAVLARGQAALCAEAVGAMEQALDLTVEYLKQRQQFGVPIGRFQALQHRAVDMRIQLEQARSMAILAAASLALPAAERDRRLSAAKVVIGNAGRFIAEQAIQLHGGMGMTEEAAVSHYAKRLVMIDHYLGDVDYHLSRFSAALTAPEAE